MGRCQDKAKHAKILKKQYDIVTSELKSLQIRNKVLEKDHIAQVQIVSDKSPDEHEAALQEFFIKGLLG